MSAETHLNAALALTAEITRLERTTARRVETLKRRRRRLWLKANRDGMTYDELVLRTGVSDGYLCREIRTARSEGPEALRESPARSRRAADAPTQRDDWRARSA